MSAGRFPSLDDKLDSQRTALLMVGLQNDFCDPAGFFPRSGIGGGGDLGLIQRMRAPLLDMLQAGRAADCLRVFVRCAYDPIYCGLPFAEKLAELAGDPAGACIKGTWGADHWEPFRPQPGRRELEVVMHRCSAFFGTDLAVILRANAISTVVITGVATSVGVDATARDAMFEDFFAVIPADASADYIEERHRMHLEKMASGFATVCRSEDVIRAWKEPQ